jgi:hypothetical protein
MSFRVGQKVVCIDDSKMLGTVKYGDVVTVRSTRLTIQGPALLFDEIICPSGYEGWAAECFRAVADRKTDISIFTAMLKPSTVDA